MAYRVEVAPQADVQLSELEHHGEVRTLNQESGDPEISVMS